jgi:hypothetical protein
LGNVDCLDALRQLRCQTSAMTTPTPLLTARPARRWRALHSQDWIDDAGLFSVRTEHALAKIAYLGLQQFDLAAQRRNHSLLRSLTRTGLGQRMLVLPFSPLGALNSALMHATPVVGLVTQLNVLFVRHPDCGRLTRRAWRRRRTGTSR